MNQQDVGDDSAIERYYWPVAIVVAVLMLLFWLLGYGPGGRACKACGTPAAVASVVPPAVPQAAPVVAPALAEPVAAARTALPPAARLYFDRDSDQLKPEAKPALRDVVAYLNTNAWANASVSGFHDPTGDPAHNDDLAHRRAAAVKALLESLGLADERIDLVKPTVASGGGARWEARRVEVSISEP